MTLDLDRLEALTKEHLVQCGPCDFGLVEYGCTCPKGDPRPVMSQLLEVLEEVRQLREQVANPPMPYEADADSELVAVHELRQLRECRDKAIKRLTRYKADTFLSEQIIAILTGTEADWYAKYDVKPSGEL